MPDINSNGIDDVEEVDACLVARGCNVVACAWRKFAQAMMGIKTLTLSSALLFMGLIDELGGVNLLQSLAGQTEDPRLGRWLMGIMAAFVVLSFVTKRSGGDDDKSGGGDEGETA